MNKKALLEYALFARKELETQIALSLNKLGIYKDHITKANVVGDFTIIEGTQEINIQKHSLVSRFPYDFLCFSMW